MEQALAESQALPETVMWQTQTSNSYRRSSGGNTSANASNAINRISDVTATDSGRNSKASPFKRGQSRASDHTSRVRYGAAQAESAIEPEEDDDEPALLESQLDPTRMRNLGSWGRNGPQQTVSTGAVGVSTGTLRQSHPHPLAYGQENFGQSEDSIERFAPVSLPVPPKRR
jgi:hypothetical protein